ncbi:MAG: hypothetical protein V4438_02860 [Patescibacteria group bacterium]
MHWDILDVIFSVVGFPFTSDLKSKVWWWVLNFAFAIFFFIKGDYLFALICLVIFFLDIVLNYLFPEAHNSLWFKLYSAMILLAVVFLGLLIIINILYQIDPIINHVTG